MPPSDVLDTHVEDKRRDMLDHLVFAELMRLIDREVIVNELLDRHPDLVADVDEDRVREWFADASRTSKRPGTGRWRRCSRPTSTRWTNSTTASSNCWWGSWETVGDRGQGATVDEHMPALP